MIKVSSLLDILHSDDKYVTKSVFIGAEEGRKWCIIKI